MDTPTMKIPSLPTTSYMAVVVLFIALATSAVGLRIYTKRKVAKTSITADDYLIICGLLCCWGLFITAIVAAAVGGINYVKGDPLDAGTLILKIFFAEPLLEFPGLSFIRISVLFFYKRIFVRTWFTKLCYVVSTIVALWGLAGFITILCSADPISRAWDPLSGNPYRIDFGRYAVTTNAIGIALDVITLLLPLPIIFRLQMKMRNKVLTAGILWLGVFCIVADSIRLWYTVQEVTAASDATGADRYVIPRNVSLWDRITPCSSIIAACLPTYAPLLRGRNILESLVRTAESWFSFGRGSKSSLGRMSTSTQKQSDAWTRASSNEHLRGWNNAQNEQGANLAHVTAENIQLHDTLKPNAVNITSTVNLNYSREAANRV
ncbi:hypothetical protein E8E14_000708 [Neopestalotiopsis sp. 37M]|nr:hypothetical protein E8E14_000708 [Neopestalotiopsis sp. 37M]